MMKLREKAFEDLKSFVQERERRSPSNQSFSISFPASGNLTEAKHTITMSIRKSSSRTLELPIQSRETFIHEKVHSSPLIVINFFSVYPIYRKLSGKIMPTGSIAAREKVVSSLRDYSH